MKSAFDSFEITLFGVIKNILSGSMLVFIYATESVYLFPNPQCSGLRPCGKISLRVANIFVFKKSGVLSIIYLVNDFKNPSGDINKGPSGNLTPSYSALYKNFVVWLYCPMALAVKYTSLYPLL